MSSACTSPHRTTSGTRMPTAGSSTSANPTAPSIQARSTTSPLPPSLRPFGVGGTQLQLYQAQAAVIDPGTSLIGAPDRIVSNFYASIPNARNDSGSEGFDEYPCSDSNLGIRMTFGGQAYLISDANFGYDQGTEENCCVGALFVYGKDGTSADQQFIVGDSFMRGVYTVFDGPKASAGFAQLSSSAPTTGPDFVASGSHGSNSNGGSGSG
ncbi:hypothetical protein A4X03_0g8058 [Tilletia caries]|uniref:Uncharacterized protein n=1 Tax=Tilletia caries TaxID=13290 RepID=A0A177U0J8_9BASI|nr:hypothetical protein CF335_g8109 [Tilletia laevis]KAE8241956.1 hypothetical protein A4X03_0g8058 [Tilletia caries]